jgi:hypothetical protein
MFLPFKIQGVYSSKTVSIVYIEPNGKEKEVQAEIGKNLLDTAHDNNIELEGTTEGFFPDNNVASM